MRIASLLLLPLLAVTAVAQTETPQLVINQSGIGSNGFGTSWRGQDVQLDDDTLVTQIVFQTGSATVNVDEIRLMTAVPSPVTLSTVTTFTTTATEVTAQLPVPYLLRGHTRYTVWFHQANSPLGTYGCNLWLVDPTWGGYHTNVDPTMAPGPGEPGYFWAYQYGTNMRLIGYQNLDVSGTLVPGGSAQIHLEAQPFSLLFTFFALGVADLPIPGFVGALRLDPTRIQGGYILGVTDQTGNWTTALGIPNNAALHGVDVRVQALYDTTFAMGGTFSPMVTLSIQ